MGRRTWLIISSLPERHPPFTSMTSCNSSTEKALRFEADNPLPVYQREIKALKSTEMPSVNRSTLRAGSWPQPLPALLKPQQGHLQQLFLVLELMEQLATGKSLQQGWESSTPGVPAALWLKEHWEDAPLSLRTEPVQHLPPFSSLSYFMVRTRGSFYLKFILLHLPQEWALDQAKAQKSL